MRTTASPTTIVPPPSAGGSLAPSAVRFEGVTRTFGPTTALVGVDLEIRTGETVALLGPNGAGKSTAIAIMLGLLEPSSGRARTLTLDPGDAVRSGRVGAMLQTAALPAGALVGELIDLVRGLYRSPLPRGAVLERAGIAGLAGRRADTLSGGEAQRVRFALAVAGDPDLVFLDEPTVAMDVESRRAFWADIHRAAGEGRTVLFATHYLDEADQVADRIVVLEQGRVVANGSPASLKASVAHRSVRFTLLDPDDDGRFAVLPGVTTVDRRGNVISLASLDADATVRALVSAGVPFRNLEVAGADLETAFLALTGGAHRAA